MRLNNIFNRNQRRNSPCHFSMRLFCVAWNDITFRTRRPMLRGGISGERRSRRLRPALDFSDHRPYTHGDDLRHVDWNAYSRHEELFVKLGEGPTEVSMFTSCLDYSRSMVWSPSQNPDVVEKRVEDIKSPKWDSARRLGRGARLFGVYLG